MGLRWLLLLLAVLVLLLLFPVLLLVLFQVLMVSTLLLVGGPWPCHLPVVPTPEGAASGLCV